MEKAGKFILVLCLFFGAVFVLAGLGSKANKSTGYPTEPAWTLHQKELKVKQEQKKRDREAYRIAKEAVKTRLLAPATAEFPSSVKYLTMQLVGVESYTFDSYVDCENVYGAKIRLQWVVKLWYHQDERDDKWELILVDFPDTE